ncbi:MAG: M48 family metalloprotease [Deltaproteobacteria bacterium]|nr:M48 family metalloprotease [Deltaproteobacteria bacterium]
MASPCAGGPRVPEMGRREFLRILGLGAAGLAAGCAVNPVTGESQLMLVSEDDEIRIDRANRAHQFSADYGVLQNRDLNDYVDRTGLRMASLTHRPGMPYSFRGVNAPYVNAYAFPGGSIACTRGILLELENEAELAALLGHELGHVNARHTAQQMSKSALVSAAVGGLSAVASSGDSLLGDLVSGLGGIGAGALLAKYSRDNEREADALALTYMTRAGYSPEGMKGLLDMLRKASDRKPNALELMFATHPMSDERYARVEEAVRTRYGDDLGRPLHRERYMDRTAGLRAMRGAIEAMQEGDKAMGRKAWSEADAQYRRALGIAPDDYAALVKCAECQAARKRYTEARRYAEAAQRVYPGEARAHSVSGISRLMERDWGGAYEEFSAYDERLPGNPGITFLKGLSLEGMGRRRDAAQAYYDYLQAASGGDQARYAYNRLVEWGYVRPKQ